MLKLASQCKLTVQELGARKLFSLTQCTFRTTASCQDTKHYRLVIIGGGTGGISMAAKLSPVIGKGQVAIVEPSQTHYYQPYWTLVGGGLKDVKNSYHPMGSVIPRGIGWIQDKVVCFKPKENLVETEKGHQVFYEFLIVAMGISTDFDKIKGLPEAFQMPGVCSNYSVDTVTKTPLCIKNFTAGNAIFTQPSTPIKCAGAPQKIMYLTDAYLRKVGRRNKANIVFNTGLGVIFSSPKFAAAIADVAIDRGIKVNYGHNLVEVKASKREAVFEKLNSSLVPKETLTLKYEMLHITPPMSPPAVIRESGLGDATGFLSVDKLTLQHTTYPNIFGIGDCTNLPTSKTAAAVAGQCGILKNNLLAAMKNKPLKGQYDGYTSCPLITGYNKCILAEFDYTLEPLQTFPFDQTKERRLPYHLKKDLMSGLYWNLMLKGYWNGPGLLRKILHFGLTK